MNTNFETVLPAHYLSLYMHIILHNTSMLALATDSGHAKS